MASRKGKVGDYDVGYGKPPKHSQFQSGQSGNPRGKKVGTRGIKSDLEAELSSKLTIQINGKPVSATTQQLMLKTLAARAASGDLKAAGLLIPLILQVFGYEDRGGDRRKLSAQDQALLEALMADAAEAPNEENDNGE